MQPMRYAAGKNVRTLLTDSDNDPGHSMQRVPRVAVARRGLWQSRTDVLGDAAVCPPLFPPHCDAASLPQFSK